MADCGDVFQDMHSTNEGRLERDAEQNYDLIDIYSGDVIVTFSRKYDTCDDDDYLIDVGVINLLICIAVTTNQKPRDVNKVLIFVVLHVVKVLDLHRFRCAGSPLLLFSDGNNAHRFLRDALRQRGAVRHSSDVTRRGTAADTADKKPDTRPSDT